jgi:hypothetical protein
MAAVTAVPITEDVPVFRVHPVMLSVVLPRPEGMRSNPL